MLKKLKDFFIGDVENIRWKDLDHKKVYMAAAVLLAVIILIVVLISSALSDRDHTKDDRQEQVQTQQGDAAEDDSAAPEEDSLEENEGIVSLVSMYLGGIAQGNVEVIESLVDVLDEQEKYDIVAKSDYIEAYRNVKCYTKKGLEENSFVAFVYYEMKILNIDTMAPGMMAMYIYMGEDGNYRIHNGEASPELEAYVLELAEDEKIAAMIEAVEKKYQDAMESDEALANFNARIQESKEGEGETDTEADPPAEPEEAAELNEPVKTVVTDTIRMRAERSTESNMVTTLAAGTEIGVYASYDDGWSKISFDGMSGYCKTEFLQSTEGVPVLSSGDQPSAEEPAAEEPTAQEPQENTAEEAVAMNKTMRLKDTVRIRAGRSADSERVATAYKSEYVHAIESYSDGWCKVEYNGTTGYCMLSYLEEV
ncbi:MAG: SH3 domain-containing protein [Lachnospiraceae bacterium]